MVGFMKGLGCNCCNDPCNCEAGTEGPWIGRYYAKKLATSTVATYPNGPTANTYSTQTTLATVDVVNDGITIFLKIGNIVVWSCPQQSIPANVGKRVVRLFTDGYHVRRSLWHEMGLATGGPLNDAVAGAVHWAVYRNALPYEGEQDGETDCGSNIYEPPCTPYLTLTCDGVSVPAGYGNVRAVAPSIIKRGYIYNEYWNPATVPFTLSGLYRPFSTAPAIPPGSYRNLAIGSLVLGISNENNEKKLYVRFYLSIIEASFPVNRYDWSINHNAAILDYCSGTATVTGTYIHYIYNVPQDPETFTIQVSWASLVL